MWLVIRDEGEYSDRQVDAVAITYKYEYAIELAKKALRYEIKAYCNNRKKWAVHYHVPEDLIQIVIADDKTIQVNEYSHYKSDTTTYITSIKIDDNYIRTLCKKYGDVNYFWEFNVEASYGLKELKPDDIAVKT